MKAQDLDFFPTNKALCLESIESGNEEQLDQLMEMVGRLVQRIEREVCATTGNWWAGLHQVYAISMQLMGWSPPGLCN